MAVCTRGHNLNGPQDKLANGGCKSCHAEAQAKYATRRKAGIALLHAVEGRGMTVGEAIALIRKSDYRTVQKCQLGSPT